MLIIRLWFQLFKRIIKLLETINLLLILPVLSDTLSTEYQIAWIVHIVGVPDTDGIAFQYCQFSRDETFSMLSWMLFYTTNISFAILWSSKNAHNHQTARYWLWSSLLTRCYIKGKNVLITLISGLCNLATALPSRDSTWHKRKTLLNLF